MGQGVGGGEGGEGVGLGVGRGVGVRDEGDEITAGEGGMKVSRSEPYC